MIPKFKSESDELLWDCLFDIRLLKYSKCFEKVKRQLYNYMPDGDNETIRQILDEIIRQTFEEFKNQKTEYGEENVHS